MSGESKMLPNYIRYFDQDLSRVMGKYEWKLSTYFLRPMIHALHDREIKNDDYVLCPLYTYHPTRRVKGGDFQVGITGKAGDNESDYMGMVREMGEEVGLAPRKKTDLKNLMLSAAEKRVNRASVEVYVAKLGHKKGELVHLTPELVDAVNTSYDPGVDDKSRKVACIVYGTEKDVLDYMDQPVIYRFETADDLAGVVAIPAGLARSLYPIRQPPTQGYRRRKR